MVLAPRARCAWPETAFRRRRTVAIIARMLVQAVSHLLLSLSALVTIEVGPLVPRPDSAERQLPWFQEASEDAEDGDARATLLCGHVESYSQRTALPRLWRSATIASLTTPLHGGSHHTFQRAPPSSTRN